MRIEKIIRQGVSFDKSVNSLKLYTWKCSAVGKENWESDLKTELNQRVTGLLLFIVCR